MAGPLPWDRRRTATVLRSPSPATIAKTSTLMVRTCP